MAKPPPRRTVVIDMGSNSFRLVAYDYVPERWWRRSDEIYDAVRIGAGLVQNGALASERIERALEVMKVYAHFCLASGIPTKAVTAVATSAIRDASNGAEFVARVRQVTELPAQILSAAEEAQYAYLAAVNSTTLSDGAVLDLGGGSLQLVHVAGRHAQASDSWPLGTVRMTERFFSDGRAAAKQCATLREHALAELARAKWLDGLGGRLVGLGGTVRNLAAHAAGRRSFGVQGFILGREALAGEIDELAARPASERAQLLGIKPERASIILAGAVVIAAAMDAAGVGELEVTEAGLREGVFFSHYLARYNPPLLRDVRAASVHNLAAQYHAELDHSEHIAALSLALWRSLPARLRAAESAGVDGAELIAAAGLLHDIGMAVDYDDHHKHSRYLLLAHGLPGFSQRELALIAQAVRYHRKGSPDLGDLGALCEPGDELLLLRIAAVLRLAEHLDRGRDSSIEDAALRVEDDALVLELSMRGEEALARWGAEQQSGLFERAFGLPLRVADVAAPR
jgi:exopolyphosphatase/guanosine-5'-triphosphate,3'-diphosphate pyrophosphatase